jgi:hypothetical protein
MIRTIAAIAAFAALPAMAVPAVASAQPAAAQPASTVGEITVYGRTNVYRVVLNTAGKSHRQVRKEIDAAANEACNKVNDDAVSSSLLTTSAISTCVEHARADAERQYDENRTDWYREVGYDYYRTPLAEADQ